MPNLKIFIVAASATTLLMATDASAQRSVPGRVVVEGSYPGGQSTKGPKSYTKPACGPGTMWRCKR